jgi:hypothetical protein
MAAAAATRTKDDEKRKKITFDFYENEYMHGHEVMIKFHSLFLYFLMEMGGGRKKFFSCELSESSYVH